MTGDPKFERTLRTQQNMAERMILFLPALWLFAHWTSRPWAVVLGSLWVVARAIYSAGYITAAEKRLPGIMLSVLLEIVLLLGATWGVLRALGATAG